MKANRFLVFAAFSAAALFSGVQAGAQTSQSVNSTATVTTPITAAATNALAFGNVTKGQANTIAASAAGAGALYFSGDEADDITISVPASANITTSSGAGGTMAVTLDRATMRSNSTDNTQGDADVLDASSGSATVALSGDADGDGTGSDGLGQVYLWIGGSVTPASGQQRGSYSGSFNVTASYSN